MSIAFTQVLDTDADRGSCPGRTTSRTQVERTPDHPLSVLVAEHARRT